MTRVITTPAIHGALALRDQQDRSGFIRSFTGSNRYIAERRAIAVIAPFQAADNLLGRLAAITNLARL